MKFLASLILATAIVMYIFLVAYVISIVPIWAIPLVLIFGLTFFIHIITETGKK